MKQLFSLLLLLSFALTGIPAEDSSLRMNTIRVVAKGGFKELIKDEVLSRLNRMDSSCELSSGDPADAEKKKTVMLTLAPEREWKKNESLPLLWKGVVIAVSRKNPYRNLSRQEAEKILKNDFPFWPETDIPVRNIYYLPHTFESGTVPPRKKGKTRFSPVRFADLAEKLLEHDPRAIVLLPLTGVISLPPALQPVAIDGILPDFDSITGGKYPLQEKYSLKVHKDAPKEISELAELLRSPAYQQKILNFGAIPIHTTNGDAKK